MARNTFARGSLELRYEDNPCCYLCPRIARPREGGNDWLQAPNLHTTFSSWRIEWNRFPGQDQERLVVTGGNEVGDRGRRKRDAGIGRAVVEPHKAVR